MTILRINPATWGSGDPITSAQLNGVDTNATFSLDKRSGQTDTISSVIQCQPGAAGGRIIPTIKASAPDADTTYTVADGVSIIRFTTATATRSFTFSNAGAQTGDTVECIFSTPANPILVKNAAGTVLFQLGDGSRPDDDGPYCKLAWLSGAWFLVSQTAGSRARSQTFTSSGTWTCPRGVTFVTLEGFGGGGGGGGGFSPPNGTLDTIWGGGGGGGGTLKYGAVVQVVPGTVYSVTIGSGGGGGAVGAAGSPGVDTTFGSLATFSGASGGSAGVSLDITTTPPGAMFIAGGLPLRDALPLGRISITHTSSAWDTYPLQCPGQGGYGLGNAGVFSLYLGSREATKGISQPGRGPGGLGGNGGVQLASASPIHEGGCGGGGGGGPAWGGTSSRAGDGGNGGAANNSGGSGANGTAGTSAPANSGGGGGGGGAGGGGSTAGTGGAGGNGGSGQLTITWVK
jgi:hypothetical protein